MQTPFRTLALALAATTFAAGAAAQPGQTSPAAQNQMTGQTTGAKKANADLPRADRSFMEKAAQSDQTELQASKLAQSKAADADVKSFASHIITDHTKASQELKQLAQSKGVQLPDEPSAAQQAQLKTLAAQDGEKFDRAYADMIGVKAHREAVALFQSAARQATDADVKAFAQKTLPTLQQHLKMAQTLHSQVGGKGAAAASR
jgi:putative membrane protein